MTAAAQESSTIPAIQAGKIVGDVFNKRVMQTFSHDWQDTITRRLEELMRLPSNWDGYGASTIGLHMAHFTLQMLSSACPIGTSAPQIVPGHNGELQVEWHTLEFDIELLVEAPYRVRAYRIHEDDEQEFNLTNEFSLVAGWLQEMETAIAARPAAA